MQLGLEKDPTLAYYPGNAIPEYEYVPPPMLSDDESSSQELSVVEDDLTHEMQDLEIEVAESSLEVPSKSLEPMTEIPKAHPRPIMDILCSMMYLNHTDFSFYRNVQDNLVVPL